MCLENCEKLFGYWVTTSDRNSCVRQILRWIDSGETRKYLVCANPHSVVEAESDLIFKKAIQNADLVIPDGIGVVIASKIFGGSVNKRITGSDIFKALNKALNKERGYRVFFLGSTEKNLAEIQDKMAQEYPNIQAVGTYSPPFKTKFSPTDNHLMFESINQFRPDVLWVGMTAPKQEKWIYENKDHLDVKFIGAVGAVFDFYTVNVKRSHPFFLNNGLEWLPRLLQEPRRLWKRNFISTPKFIVKILRAKLNRSTLDRI